MTPFPVVGALYPGGRYRLEGTAPVLAIMGSTCEQGLGGEGESAGNRPESGL